MESEDVIEGNRRAVVDYFAGGAKGPQARGRFGALGLEVEHTIVRASGEPVPYAPTDGRPGIRDVLEGLRASYPDAVTNDAGDLLGLSSDEGAVSLEPAAQVEISLAPHASVDDVRAGYEAFRARLDAVIGPLGMHVATGGYHPTARALDLTIIPKRRYALMDDYFHAIGTHGERMMRCSTSTQVSIDFASEADAVRKLRAASALAPVLAAITDDTRAYEGEPNHLPLRRLDLWRDVDDARCGTIPGVFDEGFGFASYADWLLRTSPIFVTRPAADDPQGPSERAFYHVPAAQAYADAPMTKADVEHLISMFWPDVRLKRFVEIRPADCMPPEDIVGYTALVKGVFYPEASLAAIEGALGVEGGEAARSWPLTADDVRRATRSVQERGLSGDVYGRSLASWEDLLFDAAEAALPQGERAYLAPLRAFAAEKPWWDVRA